MILVMQLKICAPIVLIELRFGAIYFIWLVYLKWTTCDKIKNRQGSGCEYWSGQTTQMGGSTTHKDGLEVGEPSIWPRGGSATLMASLRVIEPFTWLKEMFGQPRVDFGPPLLLHSQINLINPSRNLT